MTEHQQVQGSASASGTMPVGGESCLCGEARTPSLVEAEASRRPIYRTIVADPPWEFVWQGGPGGRRANATTLGYETMCVDDLIELGDGPLLGFWPANGTLLLWVTQEVLHNGEGQRLAEMWGYHTRIGEIIWRKPNFGAGAFPRIGHETCLIYKRGKGSLKPDAPRNVHSVQTWKQPYEQNGGKKHSAKPDGFYDLVREGFEGDYLELFSRKGRLGWDTWGDESLGTAEMAA